MPYIALVVGLFVFCCGLWMRNFSNQPKNQENVEGIKMGIYIMLTGIVISGFALWFIASHLQELYRYYFSS